MRDVPMMIPLHVFLGMGSWKRPCTAAEQRRNELFEAYRAKDDPDTRLVEGRYYLGDGIRLCLLLEVKPTYHVPGQDVDSEEEDEEEEIEIQPGASKIIRSVVQIECVLPSLACSCITLI